MERYQAEALAHRHVPASALLGIACAIPATQTCVAMHVRAAGLALGSVLRPDWYFR